MLVLKATGYSQNYAGIIAAPLKRGGERKEGERGRREGEGGRRWEN